MGNLTVKESGEMVSIISPNVSKITSFKVHFSPKQEGSGDPSPDNVREITGWDGVEANTAQRNIYANIKNIYRKIFIPSGTTWTASCDGGGYVYVYDANQKYIDSWALSGTDETSGRRYKTVTISSYNIYYVRINGNKCQNPQFEFGTLSEYEPVVENSITFSSDIGTIYGGYVDFISGELVQEYFKYSFTGDEDIFITSYVKTPFLFNTTTNDLTMPFGNNPNVKPYCNILNTETSKYHYISDNTAVINSISRYSQVLFRGDIFGDTAETAKAKLKELYENGTPLTIVGTIRDTVIDNFKYQLTPQQLSTLKGQNNFWSNADYVEIEYELTETFDIQKVKRKIILNQPHVEFASGDLVTFDTDMKGKLKECKVYFSPVQEGEGDPSPDNVRNIIGWNGVNIYKAGQNLIPNDIPAQFYRVYPSGGHFIESGTAFSTFFIPVPKGKICLARTTRSLLPYGALCDELPTVGANAFKAITMTNRNNYVFDNSEGHKYLAITVNRSVEVNSNWDSFLDTEPRLTISDTVQPYTVPTNISTHFINWTDSAGTIYGGYVDLVSGDIVADMAMKTFDGSETWNIATVSSKTAYQTRRSADIASGAVFTSNIITRVASLSGTVPNNVGYFGGTYLNVYAPSLSLEEWTAMLTATPLQIVYKLADPIHYQLTPQQILTLKGINNIYSDANGQMEIKYWKH